MVVNANAIKARNGRSKQVPYQYYDRLYSRYPAFVNTLPMHIYTLGKVHVYQQIILKKG